MNGAFLQNKFAYPDQLNEALLFEYFSNEFGNPESCSKIKTYKVKSTNLALCSRGGDVLFLIKYNHSQVRALLTPFYYKENNEWLRRNFEFRDFSISQESVYIKNDNEILKYDPETDSVTTITPSNQYDLLKISANDAGKVTVLALRLTDQAVILGELNEDGTLTEIDIQEPGDPAFINLIQINLTQTISIDGKANDWPTTFRVITDDAGDALSGDDLVFYSQDSGVNDTVGLIEFDGNINTEHQTLLTLSNEYDLLIRSNPTLIDKVHDQWINIDSLRSQTAIDEVIEFKIPKMVNDISINTIPTSLSRVKVEGEVDRITINLDEFNNIWISEIRFSSAIGDATIVVQLNNQYLLSLSKTSQVINNGIQDIDIVVNGGDFVISSDELNVFLTLPPALLPNDQILDPEVLSIPTISQPFDLMM